MSALKKFAVALVQLSVTADKARNLKHAAEMVKRAANFKETSKPLVVLPECFNSPYGTQHFGEYAENIPGPTTDMLAKVAQETGCYIIGGSIPECRDEKLYNTTTVFNPSGEMILRYSKLHLFDINIPGKIRFMESEVLQPGDQIGSFDMDGVKIGVGICYDIRFAELAMLLTRQKDCKLLVYPGAFNMTTGPAHWELLQRGRAVDNEVYVATCSPARDESASYHAWGHSTMVNAWGEVIATTEHNEDIVYSEVDLERIEEIRNQVPIHNQRREDLYKLTRVKK